MSRCDTLWTWMRYGDNLIGGATRGRSVFPRRADEEVAQELSPPCAGAPSHLRSVDPGERNTPMHSIYVLNESWT
ncbi:uncharacterized protein BO96DRAFT_430979 [Aspergillus niger CBS 101883]|uniref:Contig An02c0320, genomic contig n=2 Tax=Aspergillus niger TaxID=5061 RepID=A2QEH7_ASPNC|nr:uncharacterized protein BO96DRAFT_430979 [Aspergillus niger CBS 101883]XP_059605692.1 uncharacterized protein An02g11110 [Aspergillus niger]PYH59875.1 hypothetical protein BO96DRAFT_430979 [Aspergillus niger CBS 101883]CAK48776.1 unnamed protein product [Aspergillus niger]